MKRKVVVFFIISIISFQLYGQNEPVIIEAESGTLGTDYEIKTENEISYISQKTTYVNTENPGTTDKVTSYEVTFNEPGIYKLFVRLRIGAANFDDDSFFYGNGFGVKDTISDGDWIKCNGLGSAGFADSNDLVEGQGISDIEIWKWLSASEFTGGDDPVTFNVDAGQLTQTFQLGAREDGLDIDKIAFGKQDIYYTVDNLDKGESGSDTRLVDTTLNFGNDKFLGCAYSYNDQQGFIKYWNQVTPENAGKWGSVEGSRDNMNWGGYDEAYNLALNNNMIFKHHVLVWGSQQPEWMASLDSAEQRAELEEWFTAVANRYPNIHQIEVVNEPLHQPPDSEHSGGYIEALGGSGSTGWDWILESFRMARATFPDTTVLMINEYGIMDSPDNTRRYIEIINLLKEEYLIDAVGFQAHGFSHWASNSTVLSNLDNLAKTGLPLYITELDIDGLTDIEHVHGYMNLFPLFWEYPSVQGITLWGYKPGMWRTDQGANLLDGSGNERPAMKWLKAYLNNTFVPNESISVSSVNGETTIERIGGTLRLQATVSPDTSTLQTVDWRVSNSKVATITQKGVLKAVSEGTVTVTARSLELNSNISDQIKITVSVPTEAKQITKNKKFQIYPNPAIDGNFTIEVLQDVVSVVIMDVNGKEVYKSDINGLTLLNLHFNEPPGIYLIRLYDGYRYYYDKISIR